MSAHHLTVIRCDDCGAEAMPRWSASGEARAAAIKLGWTHPAFATDRCPKCSRPA